MEILVCSTCAGTDLLQKQIQIQLLQELVKFLAGKSLGFYPFSWVSRS